MCGTANPDCGCSQEQREKHRHDHPEQYVLNRKNLEDFTASVTNKLSKDEMEKLVGLFGPVVDEEHGHEHSLAASADMYRQTTPERLKAIDAATKLLPALEESKALIAAGNIDSETGLPATWHAVGLVEGLRTSDGRAIAIGATECRQLPLPIFGQFLNADHDDAPIVGSITDFERNTDLVPGLTLILLSGTFDLAEKADGSAPGRDAAQMCQDQILRWGSADLEVMDSRYVEISVGGDADIMDILYGEDDSEYIGYWEATSARLAGYTMCPIPAFPQCVIAPTDMALDIPAPMGEAIPMVEQGLVASAVDIPDVPPSAWFSNPGLAEITPLTVTSDGRVFGHLATWDTCHIGIRNKCVRPPRSETDYAYFMTGKIETAEGTTFRVGQITFDTGHAEEDLTWTDTAAHYDHTGHAAADIAVGEDDFGIWVAGALRSGLTDKDVRAVRAAPLSGDWRTVGRNMELVAALSVNVPGFPIVASAGYRINSAGQEEQTSLVAAPVKRRDPVRELARQLRKEMDGIRASIEPLKGLAVEQLSARVNKVEQMSPADVQATIIQLSERVNKTSVG